MAHPAAAPTSGQNPLGAEKTTVAMSKSPRVLSCVQCSHRKIKCDRVFPCSNCVKTSSTCVPAGTLPRRPRRRRFAEKELLDRLRQYESLLRQNSISFEPLHPHRGDDYDDDQDHNHHLERGSPSDRAERGPLHCEAERSKAVSFLHAVGMFTLDDENDDEWSEEEHQVRASATKDAWRQGTDQLLFFGSPSPNIRPSAFHPNQVQIFKLWQVYLDNINHLLKVTHATTLQARIISAVGDMSSISPPLEALMFSIYCVAVASLTSDQCQDLFSTSKDDLLSSYFFACRQALQASGVLQSKNIDCLTALYLYLVAIRPQVPARPLSSILAVAIRIAKRLDMHIESSYSRHHALEGEMRRRLWWSMTLFDHRICEMSDYKDTSLVPTWDCRPPHNVNDLDLGPSMKSAPAFHDRPADSIFVVVRSEVADALRHSAFHINFINPSLNAIVQSNVATRHRAAADNDDFSALQKTIEDKYLAYCDPENAIHFITIWTTRSTLARNQLLQYYYMQSTSSTSPTEQQRDNALFNAIKMLECDTRLRTTPLAMGFLWFADMYVPAIAFNHILNALVVQPDADFAETAWEAMSDNYDSRHALPSTDLQSGLNPWTQIVLRVWEMRETVLEEQGLPIKPARIVARMRSMLRDNSASRELQGDSSDIFKMPTDFDTFVGSDSGLGIGGYLDVFAQSTPGASTGQLWTGPDWSQINMQTW